MQIPNEYLNYIIGALAAIAFTWFRGWLKLPFLDGAPPVVPPRPLVVVPQPAAVAPEPSLRYEATVTIPEQKLTTGAQQ